MKKKTTARPAGRPAFPPHEQKITKGFRVNRIDLKLAEERAAEDGVNIQEVVREFLEGYANRMIDLPRVVKRYN